MDFNKDKALKYLGVFVSVIEKASLLFVLYLATGYTTAVITKSTVELPPGIRFNVPEDVD